MNPRLISAGARVIDCLEKVRQRVQPRVDNLLARMAVAERTVDLAAAQLATRQAGLRASVTAAFFAALVAQERVRLAQVSLELASIGSQTAGADGNVSFITFPGNYTTRFSGIGVYYPDGEETQRIGIVPDIEVKPTIQGVREGRDEVLEKALELLK